MMSFGDTTFMEVEKGLKNGWLCHKCAHYTRAESTRLMDIQMLIAHGQKKHLISDPESLNIFVREAIWEVRDPDTSNLGRGYGPCEKYTPEQMQSMGNLTLADQLQIPDPGRGALSTLLSPDPNAPIASEVGWYGMNELNKIVPSMDISVNGNWNSQPQMFTPISSQIIRSTATLHKRGENVTPSMQSVDSYGFAGSDVASKVRYFDNVAGSNVNHLMSPTIGEFDLPLAETHSLTRAKSLSRRHLSPDGMIEPKPAYPNMQPVKGDMGPPPTPQTENQLQRSKSLSNGQLVPGASASSLPIYTPKRSHEMSQAKAEHYRQQSLGSVKGIHPMLQVALGNVGQQPGSGESTPRKASLGVMYPLDTDNNDDDPYRTLALAPHLTPTSEKNNRLVSIADTDKVSPSVIENMNTGSSDSSVRSLGPKRRHGRTGLNKALFEQPEQKDVVQLGGFGTQPAGEVASYRNPYPGRSTMLSQSKEFADITSGGSRGRFEEDATESGVYNPKRKNRPEMLNQPENVDTRFEGVGQQSGKNVLGHDFHEPRQNRNTETFAEPEDKRVEPLRGIINQLDEEDLGRPVRRLRRSDHIAYSLGEDQRASLARVQAQRDEFRSNFEQELQKYRVSRDLNTVGGLAFHYPGSPPPTFGMLQQDRKYSNEPAPMMTSWADESSSAPRSFSMDAPKRAKAVEVSSLHVPREYARPRTPLPSPFDGFPRTQDGRVSTGFNDPFVPVNYSSQVDWTNGPVLCNIPSGTPSSVDQSPFMGSDLSTGLYSPPHSKIDFDFGFSRESGGTADHLNRQAAGEADSEAAPSRDIIEDLFKETQTEVDDFPIGEAAAHSDMVDMLFDRMSEDSGDIEEPSIIDDQKE